MKKISNLKKGLPIIILSLLAVQIYSCSKSGGAAIEENHHTDFSDDIFPEISISQPVANQVYNNGDSIIVEALVTDNKGLYQGKVSIKNEQTSLTEFQKNFESHFLKTYNIRAAYKTSVNVITEFTVIVEYEDHGLNKSTKSVKIKMNP